MKKTIAFLLILMLLLSGCGKNQEVTYYVTESLVELPSASNTMRYVHTFDDQWRTLSTTASQNGEVWSTIVYSYSEDNSVVSITSTAYGQTTTGEHRRVLDKDGNVIKLETWEEGQQTAVSYREYDDAGRLTADTTTYFDGYMRGYKQSFSYDAQGNKTLAAYEMTLEDGTITKTRTEIHYDSQGNRAREVEVREDAMTEYIECSWEGNVETSLCYTPDGALNRKRISAYDDHGNLLYQELYDSEGTLGNRTSYRYVGSDGSISSGIPE